MKRKRYTEEQILSVLQAHEGDASVPARSRRHGVVETPSIAGSRSSAVWRCQRPSGNGRRFRVLNIIGDCSREYVLRIVDFSISERRLANEFNRFSRQLPKTTVGDNGPAFTSKAMDFWAKRSAVKLHCTQPGKPT